MRARLLALVFSLLPACGASLGEPEAPGAPLSQLPIQAPQLSEDQLAPELKRILSEGAITQDRLNRLAGVVRAQLTRAGRYYQLGQEEAGMRATLGALFLIRAGELRREMFAGAEDTLLLAAAHAARFGNEGQAQAFYRLALAQFPEGEEKARIQGHLHALDEWQSTTRTPGSVQAIAEERDAAVQQALIETTPEALAESVKLTNAWLRRAMVEGKKDTPPTTFFDHDERIQMRRAVIAGAPSLVALYLRNSDAAGAVAALETEPIASVTGNKVLARLADAADGNPEAWADLFGLFESAREASGETVDPDLARGASFGAAIALYRSEPLELRAAIPLTTLLVDHGMGDVAPLILQDVIGEEPEPQELAWVSRLLFGALDQAEQLRDIQLARRVFENGKPLFELTREAPYQRDVSPDAADFYFVMGAMESRAGQLERARPLLELAIELKPSREGLRLLAAIDRQRGDLQRALETTLKLVALAQKKGDIVAEARARILLFDVHRELNQMSQGVNDLKVGLEQAIAARNVARNGGDLAAAEVILAQALERYGKVSAANRAASRAHDAAQNNLQQLTVTLLDAARRALTFGDLAAGRLALRRAIDARLAGDDLVYAALWVKLLHERLGVTSDGTVEEALAMSDPTLRWTDVLRDWGRGEIETEALLTRAETPVEKVEAQFYAAMTELAKSASGSNARLASVARSEAIELIEVRIARDLLARAGDRATPDFPSDIQLP